MVRYSLASALVWWCAAAADPRCEEGCASSRNAAEHMKKEACRGSWRTMPRPKIGNACQDGFFRGFDASCVAVCATFINKDFDELGAMPRKDQGEACADYRQQLPKPTTMRACGTGYNAGYEWGLKEADAIVETANAAGMSSEPMAEVAEVAEEELEEEPEEEPVES